MSNDRLAAYLDDARSRYEVFRESDTLPALLDAVEAALKLASELDAEDGYDASDGKALGHAVSRGDRIREAISAALLGEASRG